MEIENLVKFFETKKKCKLELTGLITLNLVLENIIIFIDTNNIWLVNNNEKILGINKHQILKITYTANSITIKLDQLLKIHIS